MSAGSLVAFRTRLDGSFFSFFFFPSTRESISARAIPEKIFQALGFSPRLSLYEFTSSCARKNKKKHIETERAARRLRERKYPSIGSTGPTLASISSSSVARNKKVKKNRVCSSNQENVPRPHFSVLLPHTASYVTVKDFFSSFQCRCA